MNSLINLFGASLYNSIFEGGNTINATGVQKSCID